MGNSMTKSELLAELYGRLPTFRERDCMDAAGLLRFEISTGACRPQSSGRFGCCCARPLHRLLQGR